MIRKAPGPRKSLAAQNVDGRLGYGLSNSLKSYPEQNGFITRGLKALYSMEYERRNLLQYSEALDNSQWVKGTSGTGSAPVITADHADGPLGYGRATRVQFDKGAGSTTSDQSELRNPFTVETGERYTFSVWMKSTDGASTYDVRLSCNGEDPSTPTVTGEWQRFDFEAGRAADTNGTFKACLRGGVSPATSQTADVLMWGAQVTKGANNLLPYTPTTNKQALYDYSGNGNDAYLGSAGSAYIQPVGRYLSLPGSGANYASTPDSAAASITGDIDVRVKAAPSDWNPTTPETLIRKRNASLAWGLDIRDSSVQFFASEDGSAATILRTSSVGVAFGDGEVGWVRATLDINDGAGSYSLKFFTSDNGEDWTQLGDTLTGTAIASIFDSADAVEVGATQGGTSQQLDGRIYRAQVYDGIDGTLAVDFNAEDAHGDVSQFYSQATGELWTINQASYSDTNDPGWTGEGIDFDGSDDHVVTPLTFTGGDEISVFAAGYHSNATAASRVFVGGTSEMTLRFDSSEQPEFVLNSFTTNDRANITGAVAADTPIFMAGKYDGATLSVYQATEVVSVTPTGSYADVTLVELGRLGPSSGQHNGGIEIVGFYDAGLSDSEVAQNYRAAQHLLSQRGVSL